MTTGDREAVVAETGRHARARDGPGPPGLRVDSLHKGKGA